MLPDYITSLNPNGYLLCNGGIVEVDGATIISTEMNSKSINRLIEECEKTNTIYYLENGYDIYTNDINDPLHNKFLTDWDDPTEYKDISKRDSKSIIIMMLLFKTKEANDYIYNMFKDSFKLLSQIDGLYYDVNALETNKGNAILKCAEKENISLDDCYAFGDSYNDIEMIKTVGHGYCMGNGCQGLKNTAKEVIKDVLDDGVYYKLVELGLIDPLL